MGVLNVKEKGPFCGIVISSAALLLFRSFSPVPASPLTVPPMVKLEVTQVIATVDTFALAVPEPLATVQVCVGVEGCPCTVTA